MAATSATLDALPPLLAAMWWEPRLQYRRRGAWRAAQYDALVQMWEARALLSHTLSTIHSHVILASSSPPSLGGACLTTADLPRESPQKLRLYPLLYTALAFQSVLCALFVGFIALSPHFSQAAKEAATPSLRLLHELQPELQALVQCAREFAITNAGAPPLLTTTFAHQCEAALHAFDAAFGRVRLKYLYTAFRAEGSTIDGHKQRSIMLTYTYIFTTAHFVVVLRELTCCPNPKKRTRLQATVSALRKLCVSLASDIKDILGHGYAVQKERSSEARRRDGWAVGGGSISKSFRCSSMCRRRRCT